ncbi:MAG: hypothetical protein ABIB71_03745 [Candidatus Woesearchaeota archaeon]
MVKIIENFDYFQAVDATVRRYMKAFETEMLPVAEQALKDAGFPLGNYPVEGYYPETKELTQYFLHVRTLQDKYTTTVTGAIQKLHDIYTHPVFGLKQGKPNAINPTDVYFPEEDLVTISPVVDPVTVASKKIMPNWTIDGIMENVEKENLGEGLVGFAYMVDELAKGERAHFNPVATTMACETTVLSRMKMVVRGLRKRPQVDWRVTPEVEGAGKGVIESYSDLMGRHSSLLREVPQVTPDNICGLLDNLPSVFRIVNLNSNLLRDDGHYHWAIDSSEEDGKQKGLVVKEIWSDKVITTEEYQKSKGIDPKF